MKPFHWYLIIALLAVGYVFFRGGENDSLNYNSLAVSEQFNLDQLDLSDDLDISKIPEIGKAVIRDAAQKGLKEQAFLEYLIQNLSNRIRAISTIDLNSDDKVDPILIKPEPAEGEKHVLLSIMVPAHDAYPLPKATDAEGWKKVDTLQLGTMSVSMDPKQLTVQAQADPHTYSQSSGKHYVTQDRSSSFLQTYMALSMMRWMFSPPYYGFYGAGYGYGGYRSSPVNRSVANSNRSGVKSSPAQSGSAIRNSKGKAPSSSYSRAFSSTPPKSLSNLKSSSKFRKRQITKARSGGFRSRSNVSNRPTRSSRTSRFGGFGRGSSRSSFGGGGSRFGK